MMMRVLIPFLIAMLLLSCGSDKQQAQEQTETSSGLPETRADMGGVVTWELPDSWVEEKPETSMRKAQFRLPGVEGAGDAEMAVFVFPGTGGSVQANLQRWYGQFKQPGGGSTEDIAKSETVQVGDLNVTTVYFTGTYLKSQSPMMMGGPTEEVPNSAMLAAIVETGDDPWFFKAVGPQKTIDHWRPTFKEFVRTFSYRSE